MPIFLFLEITLMIITQDAGETAKIWSGWRSRV
jgi:hypothetical protein